MISRAFAQAQTHRSQHALVFPNGAAAAEEADEHDDEPDGNHHVGERVDRVDLGGVLEKVGGALVCSQPYSDSENGTSQELEEQSKSMLILYLLRSKSK